MSCLFKFSFHTGVETNKKSNKRQENFSVHV